MTTTWQDYGEGDCPLHQMFMWHETRGGNEHANRMKERTGPLRGATVHRQGGDVLIFPMRSVAPLRSGNNRCTPDPLQEQCRVCESTKEEHCVECSAMRRPDADHTADSATKARAVAPSWINPVVLRGHMGGPAVHECTDEDGKSNSEGSRRPLWCRARGVEFCFMISPSTYGYQMCYYIQSALHPTFSRPDWLASECKRSARAFDLVGRTEELDTFLAVVNGVFTNQAPLVYVHNPTDVTYKTAISKALAALKWPFDQCTCGDQLLYSSFCRQSSACVDR